MRNRASACVLLFVAACAERAAPSTHPEAPKEPVPAEPAVEAVAEAPAPEPTYVLPADYLQFDGACLPGARVVVAAVGDILMHQELQRHAHRQDLRWRAIWAGVEDQLSRADLTYGNVEGPIAPGLDRDFLEVPDPGPTYDGVVYAAYPRFNYHPSLAVDLRKSGFDIVSTANNHALDRGPLGVDRTIESLRAGKLSYVGTRRTDDPEGRFYATKKVGELEFAFLSCTTSTNGIADEHDQVMRCDRDDADMRRTIGRLRSKVDVVIVFPHWGKEYEHVPREKDVERAHAWLEAGAQAVIGSHPHVLQPWERFVTSDGRETFIAYSLGNFASHQPQLERRSSTILYLGFTKGEDGRAWVNGVRHLPTHVRQVGEGRKAEFLVESVDRVGGPAESRAMTTSLLSPSNVVGPEEPLDTAPHCDADWRPHP